MKLEFKYGKDLLPLEKKKMIGNAALVLSLVEWAEFCQVEMGERLAKWRNSMHKMETGW